MIANKIYPLRLHRGHGGAAIWRAMAGDCAIFNSHGQLHHRGTAVLGAEGPASARPAPLHLGCRIKGKPREARTKPWPRAACNSKRTPNRTCA